MHPLVSDQLRALALSEDAPPDADGWRAFLRGLDRACVRSDEAQRGIELAAAEAEAEERGLAQATVRQLEEQLRQAQKMEAIGQLAGGVAHDFNNILAAILSYAELAAQELGADHPAAADLAQIVSSGQRAAALTARLLAFSRREPRRTRALSLDSVVAGMESMLRRVIAEDIVLSTLRAARTSLVEADPGQLEQVLLNLVVNARDAMPKGGDMRIETRDAVLDDATARRLGLGPGDYVALEVRDTGCGMDAATQARMFEPFFTTKEAGRGTGLGLSTVQGIVRQSRGGVDVRSTPGKGTTFAIYFPRVTTPGESVSPQPAHADSARGHGTVLVVEDDQVVRAVVQRVLEEHGYTVVAAPGAVAALDALAARRDPVDLVLTDLVMPEMDGRAMAAIVRERLPRMQVIYMTGYVEHPALSGLASGAGDVVVAKPFTPRQILAAVHAALAPAQASTTRKRRPSAPPPVP